MSICSSRPAAATTSVVAVLLPIMAIVLISFLVIGLAMPVLPLYVHEGLGLGTFAVGLVAGAQFLSLRWPYCLPQQLRRDCCALHREPKTPGQSRRQTSTMPEQENIMKKRLS